MPLSGLLTKYGPGGWASVFYCFGKLNSVSDPVEGYTPYPNFHRPSLIYCNLPYINSDQTSKSINLKKLALTRLIRDLKNRMKEATWLVPS